MNKYMHMFMCFVAGKKMFTFSWAGHVVQIHMNSSVLGNDVLGS